MRPSTRSHQDTSFGHSAGDRATQWVLPPHQKLASDLSDRALGRMPHVFGHAPKSMLWCLAIGQAHATGGLPPHGSSARSEVAFALVHAIAEQLDLSEVAVGVSLSGTNAAVPEFHITMQLRDASCAAANGLLHALCMHKAVSVALPSGQRVTVPAYDYGAARSVRAKRVLVRSLDPLYCMEGIMPVLLAAAGYNTQHPHAPADYVCVLSEQAGTPQIGGLADMSTVVAYVIPPPDDPLLLRLPAKFVDYADKTTMVLVQGDRPDMRAAAVPTASQAPSSVPAPLRPGPLSPDLPPLHAVPSTTAAARTAFHASTPVFQQRPASVANAASHAPSPAAAPSATLDPVAEVGGGEHVHAACSAAAASSACHVSSMLPGASYSHPWLPMPPLVVPTSGSPYAAARPHHAGSFPQAVARAQMLQPHQHHLPPLEVHAQHQPEQAQQPPLKPPQQQPQQQQLQQQQQQQQQQQPWQQQQQQRHQQPPQQQQPQQQQQPASPLALPSLMHHQEPAHSRQQQAATASLSSLHQQLPPFHPMTCPLHAGVPAPPLAVAVAYQGTFIRASDAMCIDVASAEDAGSAEDTTSPAAVDTCMDEAAARPAPLVSHPASLHAYPVSDGRSSHPDGVGSEPYDVDESVAASTPASHAVGADFGGGQGYSLGMSAKRQAKQLAVGPAPMSDMRDSAGAPVVPAHHTLEMDGDGQPMVVPVHQLASNIAPTAKHSPQDRRGIGAAPESASWSVRDPMLKLIGRSYARELAKPGAPSPAACVLAIFQRSVQFWRTRRAAEQLDMEMTRRIDEYMRSALGSVRGPSVALAAARQSAAAPRHGPLPRRSASKHVHTSAPAQPPPPGSDHSHGCSSAERSPARDVEGGGGRAAR